MALLFNKVTSLLGEDLTDLSVSSSSVRTHPRRVYFESCADAAVRETGRNGTRKVKLTRAFSLRDSDFTRLTMSIDNRGRIQFSAFIYNMCSFMAAYYLIQAKLFLYWDRTWQIILYDSVSCSLFLRAKLHKLHNRHLCNASNLCMNGYVK